MDKWKSLAVVDPVGMGKTWAVSRGFEYVSACTPVIQDYLIPKHSPKNYCIAVAE